MNQNKAKIVPATATATTTNPETDEAVRRLIESAFNITVNVGVPGNLKKVVLDIDHSTVGDALAAAKLSHSGYEIRVAGEPVALGASLTEGQTVLLLRPVVGNLDLGKGARDDGTGITVNVGVPGNLKKVVLAGGQYHTVADVLTAGGLSASGYELRVAGEPVKTTDRVLNGQTVLLLRPVVGNTQS